MTHLHLSHVEQLSHGETEEEFEPSEDLTSPAEPDWLDWSTSSGPSPRGPFVHWLIGLAWLILGVLIGIGVSHVHLKAVPASAGNTFTSSDTGFTAVSNHIVVDVKGDVRQPGLVEVPVTARIQDVVLAAGGFVHPEDSVAVNLAAPVDDGEEVVIPNVTEKQSPGSRNQSATSRGSLAEPTVESAVAASGQQSQVHANMKIDLNTADEQTLQTIPGVGPSKAAAIVAYRQEHGGFQSITQLEDVKGIGPVTYSRIAPYVVIFTSPVK